MELLIFFFLLVKVNNGLEEELVEVLYPLSLYCSINAYLNH